MPDTQTTADNLTCVECGYQLRGLETDSNCPECGHPISDSAAALPLLRWLPDFRRGLVFLAIAMLLEVRWVKSSVWSLIDSVNDPHLWLNPEGPLCILYSVVFFPAVWLLTRPAAFLSRNPVHFRKPVLALLIIQFLLGPTAICCFRLSARSTAAGVILLTAYALMPIVRTIQVWLFLELFIRPLPLFPSMPPRRLLRIMQWLILYTYFADTLFWVITGIFRMIGFWRLPQSNLDVLPPSLHHLLDVIYLPSVYLQPYIMLSWLLILLWCIYQLHARAR